MDYLRPTSLDAALSHLAERERLVLAGGTDVFPARVGRPLSDEVLDITALADLRGIGEDDAHWRIGALTTWRAIADDRTLPACFDGLKAAAREIGGPQIQNMGTLGGNLANASPAADGVPNLIALDGAVELRSTRGIRHLAIDAFMIGNRRTARRPDELLTAILVPKLGPARQCRASFQKVGARKYLVIAIVSLAAIIHLEGDGAITAAALAVGACSVVPRRLPSLERALIGRRVGPDLDRNLDLAELDALMPIDDVRGTARYRRAAAKVLVRRALRASAA